MSIKQYIFLVCILVVAFAYNLANADESVSTCNPVTKTVYVEKIVYVDRLVQETHFVQQPAKENKKNRLRLLVGVAPQRSLNVGTYGTLVNVSNEQGLTGGLGYDRLLNKRWSLGVQGQTNGSAFISAGIDF